MRKLLAILALLGLVLSGCGGGSDSTTLVDTPAPTVSTLSGTAAAGAPIIGQVTVKDSSTPVKTVSAVIEADGNYSVDVTGMTARITSYNVCYTKLLRLGTQHIGCRHVRNIDRIVSVSLNGG